MPRLAHAPAPQPPTDPQMHNAPHAMSRASLKTTMPASEVTAPMPLVRVASSLITYLGSDLKPALHGMKFMHGFRTPDQTLSCLPLPSSTAAADVAGLPRLASKASAALTKSIHRPASCAKAAAMAPSTAVEGAGLEGLLSRAATGQPADVRLCCTLHDAVHQPSAAAPRLACLLRRPCSKVLPQITLPEDDHTQDVWLILCNRLVQGQEVCPVQSQAHQSIHFQLKGSKNNSLRLLHRQEWSYEAFCSCIACRANKRHSAQKLSGLGTSSFWHVCQLLFHGSGRAPDRTWSSRPCCCSCLFCCRGRAELWWSRCQ